MTGIVATAQTDIHATPEQVWAALTEPDRIAAYLGGSRVETTWDVGSEITWSGEYDGHPYQDKGVVLAYDEPRVLSVSHYSPRSGQDDIPENYHTLVYALVQTGEGTRLSLTQDNCTDAAQGEKFSANWQQVLEGLKAHVES